MNNPDARRYDSLLGLLRGEEELSIDTWTFAKSLEERRRVRVEASV